MSKQNTISAQYSQTGNKMLTYTTMKGGVLAVDHFPTLVFGVVIAEDACSWTSFSSSMLLLLGVA